MNNRLYMAMKSFMNGYPSSAYEGRPFLQAFITKKEGDEFRATGKVPQGKITWGVSVQDAHNRASKVTGLPMHEIELMSSLPINLEDTSAIEIGMLQSSRMEIPNYSTVLRKWFIERVRNSPEHETEIGKQFLKALEDEK